MKEFHFHLGQIDPVDIARRDYLEYFVEGIISHEGNPKKLTSLSFLVKWLGYDASWNSWEPWANLRRTVPLHDYLRRHNMEKLIPQEFLKKSDD